MNDPHGELVDEKPTPVTDNDWRIYEGLGNDRSQVEFPRVPPWREFEGTPSKEWTWPESTEARRFQTTKKMVEAVNAAIWLRRPLLLTGRPGSGKSSLIRDVAQELGLGPVLQWNITSRTTLRDGLYDYDAVGRLQAGVGVELVESTIDTYLTLGPLGTALLPAKRPRALLIDEIDKSDIDLPNDLLHVLEDGEFKIRELARLEKKRPEFEIKEDGGGGTSKITAGHVKCQEFPFVVMTSNGERDFPAPFLRRCVRFAMPPPTKDLLERIIRAHLNAEAVDECKDMIEAFAKRAEAGPGLATDQLLNAVFLRARGRTIPDWGRVHELLVRELGESDTAS